MPMTICFAVFEMSGEYDPNQCDSVSYEVCGEFVQVFDKLYKATDEINPMLLNPNQDWWQAKLLVEYEFDTNEHGIKRLVPGGYVNADLYDYGKGLAFPGQVSESTGAWTLKRDKNWVRCGRYAGAECYKPTDPDDLPRLESNDESHAIRCCSDDDTLSATLWSKVTSNTVNPLPPNSCPNRLKMDALPGVDNCPRGTFDEAVLLCAKYGGRLCSSEELKNNCAALAGCNVDSELVWAAYTYEYGPAETGCLSSQNNYVLSNEAMTSCDDSRSLLVGSSTSVGALARLAGKS